VQLDHGSVVHLHSIVAARTRRDDRLLL